VEKRKNGKGGKRKTPRRVLLSCLTEAFESTNKQRGRGGRGDQAIKKTKGKGKKGEERKET